MASGQSAKTTNILVVGSIFVIAILLFGMIWAGRSARKDTAKAVSTVSLLYLDEPGETKRKDGGRTSYQTPEDGAASCIATAAPEAEGTAGHDD